MQQNPAETLREIQQLRGRTHKVLNHFSFPCILFGALMILSAVVGFMFGGLATGIFWIIAGPLGGAATGLYYHRRGLELGVETNPTAWIVVSMVIMIGCLATGFAGGFLELDILSSLGPLLFISAGYIAFGILGRSPLLAATSAALAVSVISMWALGAGEYVGGVGTAGYGAVLLAIGLMNRRTEVWSA